MQGGSRRKGPTGTQGTALYIHPPPPGDGVGAGALAGLGLEPLALLLVHGGAGGPSMGIAEEDKGSFIKQSLCAAMEFARQTKQ